MHPHDLSGPDTVDVTVVVPTYNERERIAELVRAVCGACEARGVRVEMVIVDDNSPDGTGQVADELAQEFPLRVIHRAGKLGLGTAVVAGFGVARSRTVGVMDADFSHPPALVPSLLAVFEATHADVVIASRYIPGGSTPDWPLWRRLLSRAACVAARPLSPVRDAASGFFLIRHDLASGAEIRAGGFKICLELLVRAWPERLVEVPYRFDDREQGHSKMSFREALGYLVQLRDLYTLRFLGPNRPRRAYRALAPAEVERLAHARQPKTTPAPPVLDVLRDDRSRGAIRP